MENKSKETFKKLVKTRAKEHALKKLQTRQENHSKMENVKYTEMKIQNYFVSEQIGIHQKKTIFKYRVRMERFGENFRAGNGPAMCPLCKLHLDNQEMGFQCPEIKKELIVKGNIEDIYRDNIKMETIQTITKIIEIRKRRLENY